MRKRTRTNKRKRTRKRERERELCGAPGDALRCYCRCLGCPSLGAPPGNFWDTPGTLPAHIHTPSVPVVGGNIRAIPRGSSCECSHTAKRYPRSTLGASLSLSLSRLTIDTDCVTLTVAVLVSYHTCDLDVCASAPLPDRGSSGGVYYITK